MYRWEVHAHTHAYSYAFKPFQNTVREACGFERSSEVRRSCKCGNNGWWALISSLQLCGFVNKLRLRYILSNPAIFILTQPTVTDQISCSSLKLMCVIILILNHLLLYHTITSESFKGWFPETFNTFSIVLLAFLKALTCHLLAQTMAWV